MQMPWSIKFCSDFFFRMTYGSLIQHLMAHVSVNKESVCRALRFVHEIKSSKTENLPESELLQPHFLSVLTFFNSQLRLASVAKAEKLQVLIHLLLKSVGSRVPLSFRFLKA